MVHNSQTMHSCKIKHPHCISYNKIVVSWISFETPVDYQSASVSTMLEGAAQEMEAHEPFSTDKVTKKVKVKVFFPRKRKCFFQEREVMIFS